MKILKTGIAIHSKKPIALIRNAKGFLIATYIKQVVVIILLSFLLARCTEENITPGHVAGKRPTRGFSK